MRWHRLLAFAVDWCCMLVWVAIVAGVGVPLYLAGVIRLDGLVVQNLVGLTVVAPIVAAAAWCESRRGGATPGKRALGLSVEVAGQRGQRASFPRALLRNTLKIGVPWLVGHAAVFALLDSSASGTSPAWSLWLLAAAYVLPVLWLISLFTPGSRTVYDRISATRVGVAPPRESTGPMIHDDLLARLAALEESDARDAYLRFVTANGDAALRRDGGPEHVTASCFVFSPDLERTLLCFHRKGGFWVQFGGHLEPQDASVADAAVREAREESGMQDLELLTDAIVDVHRHELGSGFACSAHWDIGFLAVVDPATPVVVSDESEDVAWFPVEALPRDSAGGLGERMRCALHAARSALGKPSSWNW